jgi:hypothetical protein
MEKIANRKIPSEILRQIKVESGHRCAIPTCRQTPVEIHHIVPWEQCKSHELKNLISLCPTCHARVHKGEIDRKSLKMYKRLLNINIESVVDHGVVSTGTLILNRSDGKIHKLKVEGNITLEIGEWQSVTDSIILKIIDAGRYAIKWNGFAELPFGDGFCFKPEGLSVIEIAHYAGATYFKPISDETKWNEGND